MRYVIAIAVSISLSACGNTFDGVGADLENMGKKIQGKPSEPERHQHQHNYQPPHHPAGNQL